MAFDEEIRYGYLGRKPSSEIPILKLSIVSAVFNGIVFFLLPSSIKRLNRSYVVSTIHAIVSVLAVLFYYSVTTVDLNQTHRIIGGGARGTNDEKVTYIISYSCGYFIYDTILMLMFRDVRTAATLAHHLVVVSSLYIGLHTGIGHMCHFLLLLEEISTIPLNLKAFYQGSSLKHNLLNGIFALTFIAIRLGYGTVICWYTFKAIPPFIQLAYQIGDFTSIFIVLLQATLCSSTRVLNFYWSILIVRKFLSLRQKKQ